MTNKLTIPTLILFIGAAIYLILYQIGCAEKECEPADTRCKGDIAQACDGDGYWQDVTNCKTEFDESWVCCWIEDEGFHSCLPKDECDQ